MRSKGYSRRDFLQFCGYAAAAAGLSGSSLAAVAQAFEKKPRPNVIWLHFQECTCCSESFIRSSHPIVADVLLDLISLNYTETLQAAAGHQAEKCLQDTVKNDAGKYILLVEGSVPVKGDGVYCTIAGKTAKAYSRRRRRMRQRSSPGEAVRRTAASSLRIRIPPVRRQSTSCWAGQ